MNLCQSSAFKLNQCIIKIPLYTIKRHFHSLRSSDTEVLDIFPSGAVNHCMEGMQALDISDDLDALIPGDLCPVQEIKDFFKIRTMLNDIPAPGRTKNIGDFSLASLLPALFLITDNPQQVIYIGIRLRHCFKGIFIDDHIRPQKIQQGI